MVILAKICLLGDGGVGKTSIKDKFSGKGFPKQYLPTIGADFITKQITLDLPLGPCEIKFQIWDLAGQPPFKQIRSIYYRKCVGSLLILDITREVSLYNLNNWMTELFENAKSPYISLIVLGNKIDLRGKNQGSISIESAKKFIDEHLSSKYSELHGQISYIETSAKKGTNIDLVFQKLGTQILDNVSDKSRDL
ncbi:MAG: Rab family GTPase [Candidatus Hodarchaeales archaeon]|jgi:small GTP-binding protein